MVPGGSLNQVAGKNGFAAGHQAHVRHDGSFVWADRQDAVFASSSTNQCLMRAQGNVGIDTVQPVEKLTVAGNVAPDAAARYDLGRPDRAWQSVYTGTLDYAQTLQFRLAGQPVMVLDADADLVVAGKIFAEQFVDKDGNVLGLVRQ